MTKIDTFFLKIGDLQLTKNNDIGKSLWVDLTIPNKEEVRDFYSKTIGWEFTNHPMGDWL